MHVRYMIYVFDGNIFLETSTMRNSIPRFVACFTILLLSMIFPGFTQEITPTQVAGGGGGSSFADTGIPSGARVSEVYVASGDFIDSVQMNYELPDGRTSMGPRHGGSGGRQQNTFRLDPDEYITGISGRCAKYIDSIRIHTNKRTSPTYGGSGGERDYEIDIPNQSQAVGFTGRSGDFLDAIGLMSTPLRSRMAQADIFGGRGGSPFSDDNIPQGARISEIRIQSGERIDGIQVVYTLRDGRQQESAYHGGRGGRGNVFRLDADEYVIGIYGRYGENVDSLTIRTNKRTSPTYGGRGGNADYRVDVPSGSMAIGFMGRSGQRLDAIGLVIGRAGNSRSPSRRFSGRDQRN
jgi:hypothetical protein